MVEVVLTPEQMASIKPGEGVLLRSPDGKLVGRIDDSITEMDLEVIERIRQRQHLPHKTYTTEEVLNRLEEMGLTK